LGGQKPAPAFVALVSQRNHWPSPKAPICESALLLEKPLLSNIYPFLFGSQSVKVCLLTNKSTLAPLANQMSCADN